jgi:uncharacterized protein (TIGR03118 family)
MQRLRGMLPGGTAGLAVVLGVAAALGLASPAAAQGYNVTSLVSDVTGLAVKADGHLVNPWGITASATGPFWINDAGAGVSTVYDGTGTPSSLVVTVPPPAGSSDHSSPTGIVFNNTTGFTVAPGRPAFFLFATEDGTISGWNPAVNPTTAVVKADRSATASYKGLALLGDRLYATNFHESQVDIFDNNFNFVGAVTDPAIPAGYGPFNVQNVGGTLLVTFAQQDADKHDDVAGRGAGFVEILDPATGTFSHLIAGGALNAPWGMTLAPADFGRFGGALLVGNFGDGTINAFDPHTGQSLGSLRDASGRSIVIQGLWGLLFGNGGSGGATNTLYFTAGIADENHGLLGAITAAPRTRRPGLF